MACTVPGPADSEPASSGGSDVSSSRSAPSQSPRARWPRGHTTPLGDDRSWRWQRPTRAKHDKAVDRTGPELEQQQRQQGVWVSQPRQPLPGASDEPRYGGSGHGSRSRASSDDDDEGLQQQRRQWRQHTLRSLRQDLHQQQRQGQAGLVGMSEAESSSDREFDWQPRGRAGPAQQLPQRGGWTATKPGGMYPKGYFLECLQGGQLF